MVLGRGIFPGTFTMGNLLCGFIAILSAYEGDLLTACWFVGLAGLLDALDGKVARLSGSTSQFGVELDSLADFLSFGVVPAVLVYAVDMPILGKWNWVPPLVFLMAAAYRLARYNVLVDSEEKRDFLGLPVPAAALSLASFFIFSDAVWGELRYFEVLLALISVSALLMVSHVRYDTIPDRFHTVRARIKLLVLIGAGAALLIAPRLLLFPILMLYILHGLARELYGLFHRGVGKMTGRKPSE